MFAPHYGVFAVTWRELLCKDWERRSFMIHFWPGDVDNGNLNIGPGSFYEHPDRIYQMAVGASGAYALILVHEGDSYPGEEGYYSEDDEDYLGLLHFKATSTPHITFRKLEVPDVSLRSCEHIALDDSLGLVLVLDKAGRMTAISHQDLSIRKFDIWKFLSIHWTSVGVLVFHYIEPFKSHFSRYQFAKL
ncbi:hypothetical protein B0H13DRAFT_1921357 [Mycena leptocephala]|nr:hypothetical protein B0H13DRAFT_1921357 [Mycena leptocephala]